MRLLSAHVEKFRSIDDSGEVAIQADVTALVGKNESGKTAFLQALQRLNPVDPSKFTTLDYPRRLYSDAKKANAIDGTVAIRASFEVEDEDRAALVDRFGDGAVPATVVTASRQYVGGVSISQDKPVDEVAVIRHIVDGVDVPEEYRDRVAALPTVESLGILLDEIEAASAEDSSGSAAATAAVQAARSRMKSAIGSSPDVLAAVRNALRERLPRFFYFSDYTFLSGRTELDQVFGDEASMEPGERVALSLLRLAGTDRESLVDGEYDFRKAELEAVSNKLTAEMAAYWTGGEGGGHPGDLPSLPSVGRGAQARGGRQGGWSWPQLPGPALGRVGQVEHHRLDLPPARQPARCGRRQGLRQGHRHHRPPGARPAAPGDDLPVRARQGRRGEDR